MWKFLRRQLKTKTGKAGALLIGGTIVKHFTGYRLEDALGYDTTQLVNDIFNSNSAVMGAIGMLLRDKAAKEEHEAG